MNTDWELFNSFRFEKNKTWEEAYNKAKRHNIDRVSITGKDHIDPKMSYLNINVDKWNENIEGFKALPQKVDTVKSISSVFYISPEIQDAIVGKFGEDVLYSALTDAFWHMVKWFKQEFNTVELLTLSMHFDETTPHMHIDFVPLDEQGKFNAKKILGKRGDFIKRQDSFYAFMDNYWKQNGIKITRGHRDPSRKHYQNKDEYVRDLEFQTQKQSKIIATLTQENKQLKQELSKYQPKHTNENTLH